MDKKKIAIIGCGVIGSTLAREADKNFKDFIGKIFLWDIDADKAKVLSGELSTARIVKNLEEAVDSADLVIEAATPKVVGELMKEAVNAGKDMMIMSIGGVLGQEALLNEAREKGIRVMLPSGAICGIDGIKAAKTAGIKSVTLTTRKAPRSIKGAPYLEEKSIDVDKISGKTVVFEGPAREAVKAFPKNVNVSAILSLAGVGAEKTTVKIVVSPEYTKNIHEIEVVGNAGTINVKVENVPSPDNPKTSYLAALSAIATLKEYFNTIRIGT